MSQLSCGQAEASTYGGFSSHLVPVFPSRRWLLTERCRGALSGYLCKQENVDERVCLSIWAIVPANVEFEVELSVAKQMKCTTKTRASARPAWCLVDWAVQPSTVSTASACRRASSSRDRCRHPSRKTLNMRSSQRCSRAITRINFSFIRGCQSLDRVIEIKRFLALSKPSTVDQAQLARGRYTEESRTVSLVFLGVKIPDLVNDD